MNIVVLDGYTLNPGDLSWDEMEKLGNLKVFDRVEKKTQVIIDAIGNAEVVLTNKVPITKEVLESASSVKYIGVLATGYDVVDVHAAKQKGVVVTNIPTYATFSTAQHTMALLLELSLHVGKYSDSVFEGDWIKSPDVCYYRYPLMELYGKTIGIIGFGRIGQKVAEMAQAFGMNVLFYNRSEKPELETDNCKSADLDEVLRNSDVVSLHCPLTPETRGLLNKQALEKMKKTALLLNTSRGPLVVEEDLKVALNQGVIAGAGLDVISEEPMVKENPLMDAKNCILTPHIAWAPVESRSRLMRIAIENIKAFINKQPINRVNG